MRKGQRFTPARLERWKKNGRGTGTGADYQPWHQVTRDDPASMGRSHLLNWKLGRLHHLLSDNELIAFAFATMLLNVIDLREQFPLAFEEHPIELATFRADKFGINSPGTGAIADSLGIKHPLCRGKGETAPWVMSTDFLLTVSMPNGHSELLAVCVKYDEDLADERTKELLKIEREYWRQQEVFWLLLTPSLYLSAIANSIRTGMIWATDGEHMPKAYLLKCRDLASDIHGRTLTSALNLLSNDVQVEINTAQRIFWQAVWAGLLPIDLSRRSWASASIEILSTAQFWQQNPIVSRRTTCLE